MSEKVLFEVKNNIGVITLNSPKTLNSLDKEMCQLMAGKLESWQNSESIKAVILEGSGEKAFCAGGDVVALYKSMRDKDSYHKDFFNFEYHLDLLIHKYTKPIVVLGSGIVMGGGIGIMNGASHRVVTETTKLAMPEITIGLFPDVGGSYFLNQMPGNTGLFLGTTGARFNGSDALFTKMADAFIKNDLIEKLKEQLFEFEFTDDVTKDIDEVIAHFSSDSKESMPEANIEPRLKIINELANATNILDYKSKLESYQGDDVWIQKAVKTFLTGSPTSMAVIFEQVKRGKNLSIDEVFKMETKMALNFGSGHDFKEGVRALLIDKDGAPNWNPRNLNEVSDHLVEKHFN